MIRAVLTVSSMLAPRTSRHLPPMRSGVRSRMVASFAVLGARGPARPAAAALVVLRQSALRMQGSRPPAYSLVSSSSSSSRCWSSQPVAVVTSNEAAEEAATPPAEEAATASAKEAAEMVLEVEYDPMYHNYIALTGTLANPQHSASRYSFTLQVQRRDTSPPIMDFWCVEASGPLADLAAQCCCDGMLVSVQGNIVVDNATGGLVQDIRPVVHPFEIGLVRTPSPESLVGAAEPGVHPQAADPHQYQQQVAAAAAAPAAAAPVTVPGMPASSTDPAEAKWLRLFHNPAGWFDNRASKSGKQPDFKEKVTGDALWVDSRNTPLWVFEGLAALPGNLPYTGTYYQWRLQQGPGPAAAAAAAARGGEPRQLPFLPAEPSSKTEALWVDVFSKYSTWWDNRLNKRNPRQPDFKNKASGYLALWLDSKDTPAWVHEHIASALPAAPPPRD